MKLFDYFTLNPNNENGLTITVRSEKLMQFYKSIKVDSDVIDYDNNVKRYLVYHTEIFSGTRNMNLRQAMKSIRMHHGLNVTLNQEFTKDSIPNLAFLCDIEIGNGITYTIEKPMLRTEYTNFVKAVEFYSMRLKTMIEEYYQSLNAIIPEYEVLEQLLDQPLEEPLTPYQEAVNRQEMQTE